MKNVTMVPQYSNILSLTSEEAVYYMLQDEQYHSFELPEYFNFSRLLSFVKEKVADKPFEECCSPTFNPELLSGVNYNFNLNKDGRYAIRPLSLTNPYLYYMMVRELCGKQNWDKVKEIFEKCHVPHITSCALPVLPLRKENFHKSTTILNWWNCMEQRSLELALEYRYMFASDITNCYGSINPQSIEQAFTLVGTRYSCPGNKDISDHLQQLLRAMQRGFNMGIPQGSSLYDLIAEVILAYADLLLHERLSNDQDVKDTPYEIIRFRDDYRIFCNNKGVLEHISYELQQVLLSLHFLMNSKKTAMSSDIYTDAIKPDRLAYIRNTPVYKSGKYCDFSSFQKYLMFILLFGRENKDGGMIRTLLCDLDQRIEKRLTPPENSSKKKANKFSPTELEAARSTDTPVFEDVDMLSADETEPDLARYTELQRPKRIIKENTKVLASIASQIAVENNSATLLVLRIISRLLTDLKEYPEEREEIVDLVRRKFINLPNSTYLQLWLQNMTMGLDCSRGECPYEMSLCQIAMGDFIDIWNNSWLQPSLLKGLPIDSICDKIRIEQLKAEEAPVIKLVVRNSYDDMVLSEDMEDSDY